MKLCGVNNKGGKDLYVNIGSEVMERVEGEVEEEEGRSHKLQSEQTQAESKTRKTK